VRQSKGSERTSQGLAVDIKGVGGFVAVPPSHRGGDGASYRFLVGAFDAVDRLPPISPKGQSLLDARSPDQGRFAPLADGARRVANVSGRCATRIVEGTRNDELFKLALIGAYRFTSVEGLIADLQEDNLAF
jgi:hypothetical protein